MLPEMRKFTLVFDKAHRDDWATREFHVGEAGIKRMREREYDSMLVIFEAA